MCASGNVLRLSVLYLGLAFAGTASAQDCPRACQEGIISAYMDAYIAHDPKSLPLARGAVYVENDQAMPLGEGTWKTVVGMGRYRHYFSDPEHNQAALITVIKENGVDAIFTLRLGLTGRRIREIEAMVIRDSRGAGKYEEMGAPDPVWLETVPEGERRPREQLIATANRYFTGMQNNDGHADYSFFDDTCDRLEHGTKTTRSETQQNYGHSSDSEFMTMTCRGQFETGFLGFVTRIRDRRFPVVDVERQTMFTDVVLDHDGTVRNLYQTNGVIFHIPPYFSAPRTLHVREAFRLREDRIFNIEMTLIEMPYGLRAPFATEDLPPLAKAVSCDRRCLKKITNQVLAALVAHDPIRAPLALDVRFTDNGIPLELGDGIWGTVTDVGPYKLYFADPQTGQAGVMARVSENDLPSILTLRLQVVNKKVSEIEAIMVRQEALGQDSLFRPKLLIEPDPVSLRRADPLFSKTLPAGNRSSRAEIAALVDSYFDAVEGGRGGAIPFAADCARRENAVLTTNNPDIPRTAPEPTPGVDAAPNMWTSATGAVNSALDPTHPEFRPYSLGCQTQLDSGFYGWISRIRDRSVPIIDEERGVAFVVVWMDVPGAVRSLDIKGVGKVDLPKVMWQPYTMLSPYIFRIEDGAIRRIEATNRGVPYGMPPYWRASEAAGGK